MSWPELIEAYLQDFLSLGRSPRSVTLMRGGLRYFTDFCSSHDLEPGEVTESHIASFIAAMRWEPGRVGRELSESFVARTTSVVRALFRWAVRKGRLLSDPTHNVVVRRIMPVYRVMTEDEAHRIMNAPPADTVLGLRDRAVLELLYGTGVRRHECHRLNLDDVDFANAHMTVRYGKGGHARVVPLGKHLMRILGDYLEQSRLKLNPRFGEPAFFLTINGDRLTSNLVGIIVLRWSRQAVSVRVRPHDLRHAMASHLLKNGADVRAVQAILGHVCIFSTQSYTHLQPIDVFDTFERTHPRARRSGDVFFEGVERLD